MNSMTSFIVNEIFSSINGEGTVSGELAIFVRLSGCNLRCSYCDTLYAQENDQGTRMTIPEILARISSYKGIKNITLTGGEPLFRANIDLLLEALAKADYLVNIETNGSILLKDYLTRDFADKLIFCCDYKLPSSLEDKKMKLANLSELRSQDVLKFVIGSTSDFAVIAELLKSYKPKCYIYLSAVFGKITPAQIVDQMLLWAPSLSTTKMRVQLQLHKYIWDPNRRGV